MNKRLIKYLVPAALFGTFLGTMFIWSVAFGPAKVKKQMVVCYKFNENTPKDQVEKHIGDFLELKKSNKQIVNYTAGYTVGHGDKKPDFDVMHYLTFKTEEDIAKFKQSASYEKFVNTHKNEWKAEFVINADIK
jgi:hypothetical protein